jgi:hypothetical protein
LYLLQIELLESRGRGEVDDGVRVYLDSIFLCEMVEGETKSAVASTDFNDI